MTKQVNANIGHIECFSCGELAAVRKDKNGSLYYLCLECGKPMFGHAGGQRRIQERAIIWGANGAPAAVPAWIREQLPYAIAIRERNRPPAGDGSQKNDFHEPAPIPAPAVAASADLPDAPKPPRKCAPQAPPANPQKKPKETTRTDPPPDDVKKGDIWDELGL